MRTVAIFDFDHTLITGDSFFLYLRFAAGKARGYAALAGALAELAWLYAQGKAPEDIRFFLKDSLLRRVLAGKKLDQLKDAAVQTRLWQKENAPVMRWLREHHAEGDIIVIASGGLDLYLHEALRDIPHDALICTEIGAENGVVSGEMVKGNCVRARKAERVAEWLAANGPFDASFGYGNYPHDVPMLDLLQHRIIV